MYKLIVDNRERKIIDELTTKGIPHTVSTLDVGDFHVTDDEDNLVGIWERKTYADLAASVKDKRYQEQKLRLKAHESVYKGYIIEGTCPNPTKKYQSLQPGAIESIKLGITCRDGLILFNSTSITHTVVILQKMLKKFPEYVTDSKSSEQIIVENSISSVKKENFTPEMCYISQLCQLPQVSYNTAKSIQGRYQTMTSLVQALASDRLETIDTISNLKVKDRRIGNSIAQKLCDYLVPLPKKIVIAKKKN